MAKVSARSVPQLQTPFRKQTRHDQSKEMNFLEQDEEDFFGCLGIMDESDQPLNDAISSTKPPVFMPTMQTSRGVVEELKRCGYEIMLLYSPNLTPSDFFLFPELKKLLRGQKFDDTNDVIQEMRPWL
ncbi:hypothetical protein TNCV_4078401 [Trichonephila clavipes]|nr:hypothetical protein TNCV_4078401 [Trichonephila clavipes]